MKIKVTHQEKCMMCGNVDSFIMRNETVNSNLKDSDIYQIISNHTEKPLHTDYCGRCEQQTLQMHVGWKY